MGLNNLESLNFIIAIPARLESKRLPSKVLADIEGKSMIERVVDNCLLAKLPKKAFLCTDNIEIAKTVENKDIEIIFTKKNCSSGSERISSVLPEIIADFNLKNTLVINVQGDQPFLDSNILDLMCLEFQKRLPRPEVITPIYKLPPRKIHDPNVVKTLITNNQNAIYFSRSAIPHIRGIDKDDWYKYYDFWGHVGIYGYRADVLKNWSKMEESKLSELESLEQLKLIDSGYKVDTFKVYGESLSVDTMQHLEEARLIARKKYFKNLRE